VSERTESPTGRRIGEARSEGRVARSQELNAAMAMLVGILLIRGPGQGLVDVFRSQIAYSLTALPSGDFTEASLRSILSANLTPVIPTLGLILFGLMVTGVVVTVSQTGLLWASKKVGFDFSRLNPLPGLKRIFSGQGLIELLRALLKLGLVSWVVYGFLRSQVSQILDLGKMDLISGMQSFITLAGNLAMRVAEAYLFLAIADYVFQRWQYNKSMKMTKDEVKEEMKQTEGDPVYKNRIRSQQRRIARMRMMANVKKADVVIVNPTHLAVAIQYDPQTMAAPRVLAKGAHLMAQRIVALARSSNIPVIQNIPLARAIYKTVEIDQEIPPELYIAMAEVLSYVYKSRGNSPVLSTAA